MRQTAETADIGLLFRSSQLFNETLRLIIKFCVTKRLVLSYMHCWEIMVLKRALIKVCIFPDSISQNIKLEQKWTQ